MFLYLALMLHPVFLHLQSNHEPTKRIFSQSVALNFVLSLFNLFFGGGQWVFPCHCWPFFSVCVDKKAELSQAPPHQVTTVTTVHFMLIAYKNKFCEIPHFVVNSILLCSVPQFNPRFPHRSEGPTCCPVWQRRPTQTSDLAGWQYLLYKMTSTHF